jgi:hypothetical protein
MIRPTAPIMYKRPIIRSDVVFWLEGAWTMFATPRAVRTATNRSINIKLRSAIFIIGL